MNKPTDLVLRSEVLAVVAGTKRRSDAVLGIEQLKAAPPPLPEPTLKSSIDAGIKQMIDMNLAEIELRVLGGTRISDGDTVYIPGIWPTPETKTNAKSDIYVQWKIDDYLQSPPRAERHTCSPSELGMGYARELRDAYRAGPGRHLQQDFYRAGLGMFKHDDYLDALPRSKAAQKTRDIAEFQSYMDTVRESFRITHDEVFVLPKHAGKTMGTLSTAQLATWSKHFFTQLRPCHFNFIEPTKEPAMTSIKIETKTFISAPGIVNQDAATVSPAQVATAIQRIDAEIKTYEGLSVKPASVVAHIASLRDGLTALVSAVDKANPSVPQPVEA